MLNIPFIKFHGLGNDFIVTAAENVPAVRNRKGFQSSKVKDPTTVELSQLAQSICDRHRGVGADGFLVVAPSLQPGIDVAARFFNADGSEAEMSGNGIRCIAAYLAQAHRRRRSFNIQTPAGLRHIKLIHSTASHWIFDVEMGEPILDPSLIPFTGKDAQTPVVGYPLNTSQGKFRVTVTSLGNPHCTLFVKDFSHVPWMAIGRAIEMYPFFPNRTNVEFVRVISPKEIEVRFWERGVGQTASSGTGSCGAVVASVLNGLTQRNVRVQTPGGKLEVSYAKDEAVLLRGPAAKIASGVFHFAQGQERDS